MLLYIIWSISVSDDSSAGDLDGNSFMKVETPRGHDLPVSLVSHEAQTFMVTLRVIENAELGDVSMLSLDLSHNTLLLYLYIYHYICIASNDRL